MDSDELKKIEEKLFPPIDLRAGGQNGSWLVPASTLAEVEKYVIQLTLASHNGNRTKTAESLGICVRTLRNRLREYRDQENG